MERVTLSPFFVYYNNFQYICDVLNRFLYENKGFVRKRHT